MEDTYMCVYIITQLITLIINIINCNKHACVLGKHNIPSTAFIMGMGSVNERRRYIVTASLIGWDPIQMTFHEGAICITGPMWGESTTTTIGHPSQSASNADACVPMVFAQLTVQQTVELWVIWDVITLLWCHCNVDSTNRSWIHDEKFFILL